MRITIQRRAKVPRWLSMLTPILSVALAFLFGALVLLASGSDPVLVYGTMLKTSLTTRFGISETIVKGIPLMFTGLAVAITMRMKVLNLGAEGQLNMGAFTASLFALTFTSLPIYIMLPGMILAGAAGGALWSLLAVVPRVLWGTSELIISLMLNYVAALWVSYLTNGPWRDPTARGFPLGPVFVEAGQLPSFFGTRVHAGIVIALLCAVGLWVFLRSTRWGYEINIIGASQRAARYGGMNIARTILLVTVLSGAFAGLAGMSEASGVIHRIQDGLSPGYGFAGIIVSALARHNPLGIIVVALLFGALQVGGYGVQMVGVSSNIVQILQGAVLLFVIGSDFFLQYRVRLPIPALHSRRAVAGPLENAQ